MIRRIYHTGYGRSIIACTNKRNCIRVEAESQNGFLYCVEPLIEASIPRAELYRFVTGGKIR